MVLLHQRKRNNKKEENKMEKMVDMAAAAYISTMGREKWESLTDKQKHDAV